MQSSKTLQLGLLLLLSIVFISVTHAQQEARFKLLTGFNKSLKYNYQWNPNEDQPTVVQREEAGGNFGLMVQFGSKENEFWELGLNYSASSESLEHTLIIPMDTIIYSPAGTLKASHPELVLSKLKNLSPNGKKANYLGWGLATTFDYSKFRSIDPSRFWSHLNWSARLHTTMQYRYIPMIHKKNRLEYGFGVNPIGFSFFHQDIQNPALTRRQQQNGHFDFDLFTGARMFVAFSLRGKSKKGGE